VRRAIISAKAEIRLSTKSTLIEIEEFDIVLLLKKKPIDHLSTKNAANSSWINKKK
jgi:hypothetical protein